jgi:hypothetical protein
VSHLLGDNVDHFGFDFLLSHDPSPLLGHPLRDLFIATSTGSSFRQSSAPGRNDPDAARRFGLASREREPIQLPRITMIRKHAAFGESVNNDQTASKRQLER